MTTAGIPLRWRVLGAEHRREYSDLLDRAFDLSAPKSYLADFPVWDPAALPAPNRHQLGGFHGKRLVCTASLRVAEYLFPDGARSRFGLIGAVATHPEFARRGHASGALDLAIEEGERRSVDAFALWGSASPIYGRRGFEFAGKQVRVPLRALVLPKDAIVGFEFRSGWDSAITERLVARKSGLRYADADFLWLSRHAGVEWRTLWIDGKCVAYAAWNRGIDLPNIIHEIDGDPEACLTLLRLLQARYADLEWIAHPDLLARWKIRGAETAPIESLAQFRVRALEPNRIDSIWLSGMDSC